MLGLGAGVAFDVPNFDPHFYIADLVYQFTRRYVSPLFTGSIIFAVGALLVVVGFRGAVRSLTTALSPSNSRPLIDVIYRKRQLEQGPRVVALGGGTGLPSVLRGLKEYTSNITAIVTVADDGGSSGRLRQLGFPPPGDIRNCLVALSEVEQRMQELFQYRFNGMGEALDGHSFGNLLIAAMTDITGDFDRAVKETSKVLAIRGQVLPATLENVVLCAELENDAIVRGQVQVNLAPSPIRRAFLEPTHLRALPEAIEAIREAEVLVIGPGSLFSSILPNLLVSEIREAVRFSTATRIFVCNVMTQPKETLGYVNASDHLEALVRHVGHGIVDYAIVNHRRPSEAALAKYREEGAEFVQPDRDRLSKLGIWPILENLIVDDDLVRHDPQKLAEIICRIHEGSRHLPKRCLPKLEEQTQTAA